jgi:predicted alpha/beta-fold hydrolase
MHAPWWLPGGNAQTVWAALCAQRTDGQVLPWRRSRWITPDGDFVDADHMDARVGDGMVPTVVLFHGLEGSRHSHYAMAMASAVRQKGWQLVLPHFRGCSGEMNWQPRAYHSGDHEEIGWMLSQASRYAQGGPLLAVGVSLGGNALLRWAEEWGQAAQQTVRALAAVSAPLDLAAAGHAIDRGINRQLYARMFLRTMRRKAVAKWQQFPGLFDLDAARKARTLYAFDNAFTAPLHGFRSTEAYWRQASSKPGLASIRVPALVVNARNDPFVPASSLPQQAEAGPDVQLWQPEDGGHVGFVKAHSGGWPGRGSVQALPQVLLDWLAQAGGVGHG